MKNRGKQYSDFEDHVLRTQYHKGAKVVATMLGRSEKSVYKRASKLGVQGNVRNKGRKRGQENVGPDDSFGDSVDIRSTAARSGDDRN